MKLLQGIATALVGYGALRALLLIRPAVGALYGTIPEIGLGWYITFLGCLFVFVSQFIFLLLLVLVDCGRKDKCDAGFCAAVTVGRACSLVHLPFAGQAGELSGELRRGDCGHGQAIKRNFRTAQHVKSR